MKELTPQTFLADYQMVPIDTSIVEVLRGIDEQLKKYNLEITVYSSESDKIFWKLTTTKPFITPPIVKEAIVPESGQSSVGKLSSPKSIDNSNAHEVEERRKRRLGTAYIKPAQ